MIYGVLNWCFHLTFNYEWANTIDRYFDYALRLRDKHQLLQMGFDFGIGADDNQIPSRHRTYIRGLRDRLAAENFIPIIGCGTMELHTDRRVFERSLKLVQECLPIAADLGAPVARFFPVFHSRMNHDAQKSLFVEAVNHLANVACRSGIKICSENYEILRLTDFEEILPQIDPQYGILNDIGNWLIMGIDPLDGISNLIARTVQVHIKDYRLEKGYWRSVALGEGTIDIPEVIQFLEISQWGPKIYTVEIDFDMGDEFEGIDRSLGYLLDLENHLFSSNQMKR